MYDKIRVVEVIISMRKMFLFIITLSLALFLFSCGTPKVDDIRDFHTETQNKMLNENYDLVVSYATGEEELSVPLPIVLEYEGNGSDNIIKISENKKMTNYSIFHSNTNSVEIYNLKANQIYYWTVNDSEAQVFMTTTRPRNLYIDGVTNCRDLGGWQIENTKNYVNQGLMFRTSKLTDDYTGNQLITEKGIEQLKQLGIKTEIDLRKIDVTDDGKEQGGITQSVVSGVTYISLPMKSSGNILTLNKGMLKDIFKVLGNKDNYPLIFHCSIGTDRTGLVAFLVNGLLGVSEEDLYYDYMFSNLGLIHGVRTTSTIKSYIQTINFAEGETLKDKIYNILISNGVEKSDIDSMIEIMTK